VSNVYKIRSKNNPEKFLAGTPYYQNWDKSGRLFLTLGKLRTFITNSLKTRKDISDWDIIELELTEKSVKGVHEIIDPKKIWDMLKK